jgi:CIC family chloride channel protein
MKVNKKVNLTNFLLKKIPNISEYYNLLINTEYFFIFGLAIIVGIITGFAEVFLKFLIKVASEFFYVGEGKTILEKVSNTSWYLIILFPIIGLISSQLINHFFFKKSKTHGVSQVIESILFRNGLIKPLDPWIKALTSAITIGTGGSVGPEGPAIYLGAGVGSTISQLFKVSTRRMKTLVAAGAGAGIAAAFNAPIAGALFAVEILMIEFKFNQFSVIVIATVMATFVSRSIMGDLAVFQSSSYHLENGIEFILFAILGFFSGIFSFLFIEIITKTENFFHNKLKIHSLYKSIIGGFIIGAIGIFLPNIIGTGYDTIDLSILNKMIWYIAIIIAIVKIFSTAITLSAGGSGGVFAPALVVGATLGSFFGFIFQYSFPTLATKPEAYVLLGMAGLLAGTMHAPFTSIIMIFELTKNPDFILPAMITSIISVAITKKLTKESIYTMPLLQFNINLKGKTELNVLESISVKDVYSNQAEIIYENEKFGSIIEKLIKKNRQVLVVKSLKNEFYGLITIDIIKEILMDNEHIENLLIAGDIAIKNLPKIYVNQSLKDVWDIMNHSGFDILPVFNDDEKQQFSGLIYRKDLDYFYNKELEKIDFTSNLASSISKHFESKTIPLMDDYVVSEINVPKSFIGLSIKELDIRNNYDIEILSIKSNSQDFEQIEIIPKGSYKFQESDKLVVAGTEANLNKFMEII